METYFLEKTKITPAIKLKLGEDFLIIGDSRPEFAAEFYTPIIEWFSNLHDNIKNTDKEEKLTIEFFLEYLNSSSVIFLSKVLKKVSEISGLPAATFHVNWKHLEYDEEMKELGEEFSDIYTNLIFSIISV